jgi:mannose/fructose/N-acetylgalactosamine-specific phosphotransferase system component IID
MHIVAIGWMFVVLLMTLAEATAPQGSLLGAAVTFVFYGVVPVAIVLYLLNTPHRRRARRRADAQAHAQAQAGTQDAPPPAAAPPSSDPSP